MTDHKERGATAPLSHFYDSIHGWSHFLPLYAEMVRSACDGAVFVEVGAWKGRSAAFMGVEIANSGKRIEFHAIDWGKGSEEHADDPDVANGTLASTLVRNLTSVLDWVKIRIGDSREIAETFPDNSIDFVFLDAGHGYQDVKADIAAWLPKVKPGGVMAGDDFNWPGVQQAVLEAFPDVIVGGKAQEFYPWWHTRK